MEGGEDVGGVKDKTAWMWLMLMQEESKHVQREG